MIRISMRIFYSLFLFTFITLLCLNCGSSPTSNSNKGIVQLKFKAQENDVIVVYPVEGKLTIPGNVIAQSQLNPETGISELELSTDQSYRIRLKRKGIEYIETIVLIDQFSQEVDGVLDIGELSGVSSLMTWAAFDLESNSELYTVSSALKEALKRLALISEIRVIPDIKNDNLSEATFGDLKILQMNIASVCIARMSKHLESKDFTQALWNERVDLIAKMFSDTSKLPASEFESTKLAYLDLFNTGENKLEIIQSSELQSQYIENTKADLNTLLQLTQSGNLTDTTELFSLLNLK
jgi:hypothetical protein